MQYNPTHTHIHTHISIHIKSFALFSYPELFFLKTMQTINIYVFVYS